jgi:hypothetical protein
VPFQAPAGHWILKVAPSASVPFTVVTDPEPPQVWAEPRADAGHASPAPSKVTEAAMAASLLVLFTITLQCDTTVMNEASSGL